jgi:molecular chaperone DnaJ
MRNPYEVLEIREGADKEEIKEAYRKLVKKYHPDQYINHPLSSLAQEKMKEINEAYEALMGNGTSHSYDTHSGHSYSSSASPEAALYQQARGHIQTGRLHEAEQILDNISYRDAEWNFLKGSILVRRGWYDQAMQYFQIAVTLDPGNPEYHQALNAFNARNFTYRNVGGGMGYGNSSMDCCTKLCVADCCCECMGGDLISCC